MKQYILGLAATTIWCATGYGKSLSDARLYFERDVRAEIRHTAAILIEPNQNTLEGNAFINEIEEKAVQTIRNNYRSFYDLPTIEVQNFAESAAFTIVRARIVAQMQPALSSTVTEQVANDCMQDLHTYIKENGRTGAMRTCLTAMQCRYWACDKAHSRIEVYRTSVN